MVQDVTRDAAEQRAGEGAAAARADDDQIDVAHLRELEDPLGRIALEHSRLGSRRPHCRRRASGRSPTASFALVAGSALSERWYHRLAERAAAVRDGRRRRCSLAPAAAASSTASSTASRLLSEPSVATRISRSSGTSFRVLSLAGRPRAASGAADLGAGNPQTGSGRSPMARQARATRVGLDERRHHESARLPRPGQRPGKRFPIPRSRSRPTRSSASTRRRSAAPTCTSSRATSPRCSPGTILGHEAVGTVVEIGDAVTTLEPGDRVLVSCITSCGRCRFCKEGRYGLCTGGGGWIFGHLIDGLQAEYARVPFADTSVYKVPEELTRRAGALPRRHPADRLRGRRAERRRRAGRHGRDRRRRPDRAGGDPDREAVHAGPDRRDRPRRRAARAGARVRRRRRRSTTAARTRSRGSWS